MMLMAVLVGLALVFFGRQLFWLFVGGIGFAAGMAVATAWLQGQSQGLALIVALVAGVVGAILSVILQRFALGVAGFAAGAYVLTELATKSGRDDWARIAGLVGGVLGAIFVLVLFDWALIGLSALTGALLVVDGFQLNSTTALISLAVLFVAGVLAQAAQVRRQAPAQTLEQPPAGSR